MSKSRKNVRRTNKKNKGFLNKLKKTSKKAVPVIKSSLSKVGSTVQNVAIKSEPVIKEGLGKLYSYMETGVKYTSNVIKKGVKKTRKQR